MLLRRDFLVGGLSAGPVLGLPSILRATPGNDAADQLVAAARRQVGVTLTYDAAYSKLDYPGGDVPRERGVCTDVIVRAYRDALDVDLQVLVHEDMRKAFSAYPALWGLKKTDRNIDHRRVPNLQTFFRRAGAALPYTCVMLGFGVGATLAFAGFRVGASAGGQFTFFTSLDDPSSGPNGAGLGSFIAAHAGYVADRARHQRGPARARPLPQLAGRDLVHRLRSARVSARPGALDRARRRAAALRPAHQRGPHEPLVARVPLNHRARA